MYLIMNYCYNIAEEAKEEVKHNKGFQKEDVEEYKAVFEFFDIHSAGK